jgi:molybdopterin converting factor small subunit
MSVKIHYLGILAETTGIQSEIIPVSGKKSDILDFILGKYPEFRTLSFVVSHMGRIVHGETDIKKDDLVTLIPPAPGG